MTAIACDGDAIVAARADLDARGVASAPISDRPVVGDGQGKRGFEAIEEHYIDRPAQRHS